MTPGGMAMLADMPRHEVEAIVDANMPRYRKIEGFDENGFLRSLNRSLSAGDGIYDAVVLDRSMCGLGVAVLDPAAHPIASVGVTFLTDRFSEKQRDRCLALLRQAAKKISWQLFQTSAGKDQ